MGNEQEEGLFTELREGRRVISILRLHHIEHCLILRYIYPYMRLCAANNGGGRSNNKLYIHARESSLLVEYKEHQRGGGTGRKRKY